jgi:hypothetical protein
MVIFALTVLLLTVMVCMTLSFGMKTKERLELQTVADASAYSTAVATARTMNALALDNRAQISNMVALAGVQSLLSWTAYYRSNVEGTFINFLALKAKYQSQAAFCCGLLGAAICGTFCQCLTYQANVNLPAELTLFGAYAHGVVPAQWAVGDAASAADALGFQANAIALYVTGELPAYANLWSNLSGANGVAQPIVNKANLGTPQFPNDIQVSPDDSVTMREAFNIFGGGGALMPFNDWFLRSDEIYAALGTRLHPFVTRRILGKTLLMAGLAPKAFPAIDTLDADLGSAYFDKFPTHSMPPWPLANAEAAIADDHSSIPGAPGILTTWWPGLDGLPAPPIPIAGGQTWPCPTVGLVLPTPAKTLVSAGIISPAAGGAIPTHWWFSGADPNPAIHILAPTGLPVSVWPPFIDYNPALELKPADNYGQPKNYTTIQRDYSARPPGQQDPWNLLLRTNFFGSPNTFTLSDNSSLVMADDGTNISKQTAMATGITYYHRAGHWREPPNLFNPFWRAGLAHPGIDAQGQGGDVPGALNSSNVPWAADTYNQLKAVGYKGFQ